jgi:putative membrane protein
MERWPGSVYREGDEPDPRFTFANERTFLAWLRTALGLIVAGVAVDALAESGEVAGYRVLAGALVVLGLAASSLAFFRWMANETAMRLGRPLPGMTLGPVLAGGIALVAVGLVVLFLV